MIRKVGTSTLTSVNNVLAVTRRLQALKIAATEAMATEAKQQALEVYGSDGDGAWNENAPATIAWKGHEKIMLGRTGALSEGIEIRPSPNKPTARAVGWFEDDHPDSKLTKAGLAAVHEMDRPWLSQVVDNPAREAAVLNAGRKQFGGF